MSNVVGGSKRKTVCIISSNFLFHIHVFSLQKQFSWGKTGPVLIKHHTLSI